MELYQINRFNPLQIKKMDTLLDDAVKRGLIRRVKDVENSYAVPIYKHVVMSKDRSRLEFKAPKEEESW